MFKLLASMFRNIVALKPPTQTKLLRERGIHKALDTFTQTVLFDTNGTVTSDGVSLIQTPYLEPPPKALIGKAIDVRDARALVKAMPKGKLRALPVESTYVADDNKLTFKTPIGQKVEAKAVEGRPGNWPKWQDKMPRHASYNEVVLDGKRFKKLVAETVAQDAALGKSRKGKKYEPKVVLRVSKSPEHPVEIHSDQGVQGYLLPCIDEVKHERPTSRNEPRTSVSGPKDLAKV
jgi:hypothetical protein